MGGGGAVRSRLCRARLLEAAELVAREYSPRGTPFLDDDHDDDDDDVGEPEDVRQGQGVRAQARAGGTQGGGRSKSGGGEGTEAARVSERRSYWRLKRACSAYRARREAMLMTPMFGAWLVGGKAKQQFAVNAVSGVVPLAASSDGTPCPRRSRAPPGPPPAASSDRRVAVGTC